MGFARFLIFFVFISYSLCFIPVTSAEVSPIVFTRAFADSDYGSYETDVLNAIIDITPEYGQTSLIPHHHPMPQSRQVLSLIKGDADVMWSVTSKQRESALIPIRLPLVKGFAGYRALVIQKGHQNKFPKHLDSQSLKQRSFVQGNDWPDLPILKFNGFNVHGENWSLWFSSMFTMVEKNIIDAFPRNITEISSDMMRHKERQIAIEKYHLLYYPNYEYFFIRPDNQQLANRMRIGLTRLLKNGTLEKLFNQHKSHAVAMTFINDPNRTVHHLTNPLLPYTLDYARWDLHTELAMSALGQNIEETFTQIQ